MVRRRRWLLVGLVLTGLLLVAAPWLWTEIAATGHEHDAAHAPTAETVIVLGTEVAADGHPGNRLTGRLQTAAELVRAGRARAVLVSGDGHGISGDEPAAMAAYLVSLGVDPKRIVPDAYGLDTYDSCRRARDVYGVTSALIVTQRYHLSRAVAVCRHVGLAAEGVAAGCPGCSSTLLARKAVRDFFACAKAAWDAARDRPPAVRSPADPALRDALAAP